MARQFHTTASVVLTASREQEARALALPIALASLLPSDWPFDHPLVRIQTCGCSPIIIEVLQGFDEQMQPIYAPPDEHLWSISGMTTAPILLEMLASQPGCVVSQDWLMQGLRQRRKAMQKPQADGDENDEDDEELKRPDNVVSLLRKLLYPPALLHLPERSQRAIRLYLVAHVKASRESGPSYRLAGAPLIWLDVEAMEMHAKQVKVLEQFGEDALHAWQTISEIGLRGSFLPHEPYSDWAQWRRARVNDLLWQSVNIQQQRARQQEDQPAGEETALRLLLAFWRGHLTNQDAFRQLAELLGKREHFQQAEECYAQLCTALENDGRELHEQTKKVMEFVRARQIQRKQTVTGSTIAHPGILSESASFTDQQYPSFPGFPHADTQDIIETSRAPGKDFMNQPRRQFLQQTFLKGTGVAFLTSEITERLTKALCNPSRIDENTLLYLERRIEHYWQDRNAIALPAWDLLPYVLEDLNRVTVLLEASLLPTVRTRLCTIAGVAAMLVGELYYDMRNYPQARNFQSLAVTAAHEANNADLEAVAWGRNSFAWTYDGNPVEARNSIQQARYLAGNINSIIRTWLAAVEAEIQANLGDRGACLRALEEAASIEDRKYHSPDCYWIHFDQALLAGYQGISFLKLSNRGHRDLVQNAQSVLQEALNLLDPSMKRRRPTLLVDLAGTYIQQKNIEQACSCAIEAVHVATQISSNVLLQRFLTLKGALEPWQETPYAQDFNRSIELLLSPGKP